MRVCDRNTVVRSFGPDADNGSVVREAPSEGNEPERSSLGTTGVCPGGESSPGCPIVTGEGRYRQGGRKRGVRQGVVCRFVSFQRVRGGGGGGGGVSSCGPEKKPSDGDRLFAHTPLSQIKSQS